MFPETYGIGLFGWVFLILNSFRDVVRLLIWCLMYPTRVVSMSHPLVELKMRAFMSCMILDTSLAYPWFLITQGSTAVSQECILESNLAKLSRVFRTQVSILCVVTFLPIIWALDLSEASEAFSISSLSSCF